MLSSTEKTAYLQQAQELCRQHHADLLFLTVFGSQLYGTAIPGKSDRDLRGIFLPHFSSLVFEENEKRIHYSTGEPEAKNTAQDVDIDLSSAQAWLLHALPEGEIAAIDLLFSVTHSECILYQSPLLDPVFNAPLHYLNLSDTKSCTSYCLRQAKKYGILTSRAGTLKRVAHYLSTQEELEQRILADCIEELIAQCGDPRYCHTTAKGLLLCEKCHDLSLPLSELQRRINIELKHSVTLYTEEEMDWKALSHAVRALRQYQELLHTGTLRFPLACKEEVLSYKQHKHSWAETEACILSGIEDITALQEHSPFALAPNPEEARRFLLQLYSKY